MKSLSKKFHDYRVRANQRFGNFSYFIQYCVAGSMAAFVQILTLSLFTQWKLAPWIAVGLSIVCSKHANFFVNRELTFRESRDHSWGKQYVRFMSSTALGSVANYAVTLALIHAFAFFARYPQAAAVFGIGASLSFNFVASRYWVFSTKVKK